MKLLTINEAADMKGVSRQSISAAIAAGRLSTVIVQLPGIRISLKELAKFEPNPKRQAAGRNGKRNGK